MFLRIVWFSKIILGAKDKTLAIYSTVSARKTQEIISKLKNSKELPFREILAKEDIKSVIQESMTYRERFFTPDVTLWAFLSQVMATDQSLEASVTRVIAEFAVNGKDTPSSNTAAYSQARSRLPESVLSQLVKNSAAQLVDSAPKSWLWKNRKVKLVDGSTISMPDTPENQAIYPQSAAQEIGVGFPIARIVVIIDYTTGAVLDLAIGSYQGKETGEHALFRQLTSSLNTNDILLGDCYYPSFFVMASLIAAGIDGVFPMHGSRGCDFNQGQQLGHKDHIVKWKRPRKPSWMEPTEYESFPQELTVREVEIKKQCAGFRGKAMVLVTTFLDAKTIDKTVLSVLYDYRWMVEVSLREIKNIMQMDILRGKTPEMVRKEIWVHLLAYNLIRKIMAQAAFIGDRRPRELSFKLALQSVISFQQKGLLDENNHEIYAKLLKAIIDKPIVKRPGRSEPRVVKRRPKAFPRMTKARELYKNAA